MGRTGAWRMVQAASSAAGCCFLAPPRKEGVPNTPFVPAQVEELQQMVTKLDPMAHRSMRLRFTRASRRDGGRRGA